jgi:predicted PurR-regulated permease PerM
MAEGGGSPPAPPASLPVLPTSITSGQVMAVILIVGAFEYGQGFFAPLMVAILMAIALGPPVRWLSALMPRAIAAALLVLSLVAGAIGIGYLLSDDLVRASRELPGLVRQIRITIASASPREGLIRQLQQAVSELERQTSAAPPPGAAKVTIVEPVDVQSSVMAGTRRAATWVGNAVLLLFLVYFLLATGDLFKNKFVKLAGDRLSHKKVTVQMLDEISEKVGRFVFYQAWSGLIVGLFTWLGFQWLGVRYAGLWGVAAGVLNCVPYFGPTVVTIASAAAALVQFQSFRMAAAVGGVSLVITSLEGFLLAPTMLGRAARVNTVTAFVALMFWGWLWGAVGLIIAVPVLMILKTVADHVESLAGWSELLADRDG